MILLVLALGCLAAPVSAGAITLPGAISGTVTDAVSHEPIEELEVCAYALEGEEEGEEEWRCAETDPAGDYEIANLPAGEWSVEFWGRPLGYVVQFWEAKEQWWEADPVVVESSLVTGIDAELHRGGEITGTVREASGGGAVEGVEVCAWGYPNEIFGGCVVTDPAGGYALTGVAAGEYEIEFNAWETNLLRQFYDHKANWWEADLLKLEPEETKTGIDADLEAGAQISGTVYSAATGAPLESIYVCSIEASTGELWNCTETDQAGHYVLDRIPGGSYKVVFSLDFEEWYEEEFGEEFDDGYPTEFWNEQATLSAANVLTLATGQSVSGVDAHLGPAPPAVITPPPAVTTPIASPRSKVVTKPAKHCRKGFKRKKIKGKVRCVKLRKHQHHRRHRSGRPGIPARAGAAPLPPNEAAERHRMRPQLRVR